MSSAFPPGIMVEGATPRGKLTVNCEAKRLTFSGAALAVKKRGSLPPPFPLSCGAPLRGGVRAARRGLASLSRSGRGKSVLSRA